jgi:hypothetical protein
MGKPLIDRLADMVRVLGSDGAHSMQLGLEVDRLLLEYESAKPEPDGEAIKDLEKAIFNASEYLNKLGLINTQTPATHEP